MARAPPISLTTPLRMIVDEPVIVAVATFTVIGTVMVCVFALLLVIFPASVIPAPPTMNADAPLAKVMLLNDVLAAKSLLGVSRVAPANTRSSPATGATPPCQFVDVDHRSFAPRPVHVVVAAVSDGIATPHSNIQSHGSQPSARRGTSINRRDVGIIIKIPFREKFRFDLTTKCTQTAIALGEPL